MTATDTNIPAQRRRTRGVPADVPQDVNTETAKATEDAEADIEEAKGAAQAKAITNLAKAIGKDMTALFKTVKKGDKEQREKWLSLGRHLIEVRTFFENGVDEDGKPKINKIGFGNAIKDYKIDELCPNKNNRTDAIWLADTVEASPGLVDLMELDAEDGGKSLGHPKTIKRWFEKHMVNACKVALDFNIESSKDATEELEKAVAETADGKVTDDQITAAEFTALTPEGDFEVALKKYKPKEAKVKFSDNTVEACAATIMVLLVSHSEPVNIYDVVGNLLEAFVDKLAEEATAAEEAEYTDNDAGEDAGDEVDDDDYKGNEFDEDEEEEFPT